MKLCRLVSLLTILLCFFGKANAQQPKFKGAINDFFESRLIYPEYSAHHCIQGKVNVSFRLDKEGNVSKVAVAKGIVGDLNDEAIRLVRLTSKRWLVPQNFDINTNIVVPVVFKLESNDCAGISETQTDLAISEYYKNEQLTLAVYNFYKANEVKQLPASDEAKILKIKAQLGIDDDYLRQCLDKAEKKLKQGDTTGACKDFRFIKYMGSALANKQLQKYCR